MEVVLQDSNDHNPKDVADAVRQWLNESMYLHLNFDNPRITLSSEKLQTIPSYRDFDSQRKKFDFPALGGIEEIIIYVTLPLSFSLGSDMNELDHKFKLIAIRASLVSSMEVTSYCVR